MRNLDDMTYVDMALKRVRTVAQKIGKKPFAARIGASDTLLRGSENDDWNPTASTLRSFEKAILPGEDVHGREDFHAEQSRAVPRRVAKAGRA